MRSGSARDLVTIQLSRYIDWLSIIISDVDHSQTHLVGKHLGAAFGNFYPVSYSISIVAGVNVQFNIVLDADLRYQSLIYSLSILYSSLKGTHRTTPRYYRTPTLTAASPQEKMRKQSVRETSSPRKFLKATIKQKKQSTTPIPPASDDRERDEIVEANLLSLTSL
ncbi:hypothetical protein Tco_0353675 [Tanacetum coccineum]